MKSTIDTFGIERIIMKSTIDTFGTKRWYNDSGQFHREDGPAVEYKDGCKYWALNNLLHRPDGPAMEDAYGNKEWYIEGKQILCKDNEEFLRIVKMKYLL
jgi:hypothetical protein